MYSKSPLVETKISLSKDSKWLIHQTVITDIKPVSYYEKVFETKNGVPEEVEPINEKQEVKGYGSADRADEKHVE